jgi:hypothetical protein
MQRIFAEKNAPKLLDFKERAITGNNYLKNSLFPSQKNFFEFFFGVVVVGGGMDFQHF